jgi:hypothetical protein
LEDWLFYAFVPVAGYVLALVAAVLMFADYAAVSADLIAAAVFTLLYAAIRDAWGQKLLLIGHLAPDFSWGALLLTSALHRGDQRLELIESRAHSLLHPGGDGAVQRFLAGEQLVQGEARPTLPLL